MANLASPSLHRMPKVPSLIFDMEMELGGETAVHPSEDVDDATVVQELLFFLQPPNEEAQQLAEIVNGKERNSQDPVDVHLLAEELTRQGYSVRVRRAVGGGEGSTCLHNLRHSFIVCNGPDSRTPMIVDPTFVDQFQIAKPTERYNALLDCVPRVLIISEDRITALVTFLSAELTLAFKVNGAVLPPWRQAASMMTKWQPRRSLDHSVRPFHITSPTANTTGSEKRHLQQQKHQEGNKMGRTTSGSFDDNKFSWGIKISTSRTIQAQLPQANMEPARIYGGFGSMSLIKG